ncbi:MULTISPECIES: SAM-dependent methyltransferase [Streptomyces]|uniref:Class I SAM-dependent methyltransferase n=1 Tax=Streptomyces tsukubensis (strain DSM 42081 / NBRC 108919 / NRRL 18488 / 9993) TaxID=1114943 RepID=I2MV27_STRT9|nr:MULTISPECIES: class I SAM-dependent methyltransferase [Streptomyces]AZK93115.1 methyltransferase type 12 [Streptomyces tsukubensis]EIF88624.1 hypothetical protein [Streptomyces tsukubensis NRRL18488]MYS63926.1 methyltransferase domain-containing protein [Streptomyces sp. SID5473]QKM70719.1 class I SAM-dependent methyltransferase [Streptomyces tsukubensis NRRL18488]TAI41183.1 class I SAM-dependent methyltransferase [Streptomyces tsukubensis]
MTQRTSLVPTFSVIDGPVPDPYRDKVVYTYNDSPELWRRALGDTLLFEWGDYEDTTRLLSPGEAGVRFFDRQLDLAGLLTGPRPRIRRILDLGCGWGFISYLLARRFHECDRIDAINISPTQLDYCARFLADHRLAERVRLFLCDGRDVDLLPDPHLPYDLVVVRGVYTHFRDDAYEASVAALSRRMRPGAILVISDTLFKQGPGTYTSAIPDMVDRLACGNRKSPEYFASVLERHGFSIADMRVLPRNEDVIHWFRDVKSNIETHFPHGLSGPLEELRVMADNMSDALARDKVSAYSVIARRTA